MALKGTRLIAKISKLTKSSKKIADAVKKLGGVKKSAKELLKKTANDLRSKLPASARGKLKAFSQSTEAKVAAGALAAQLKDEIWDLLSLGSCAAMWKNR